MAGRGRPRRSETAPEEILARQYQDGRLCARSGKLFESGDGLRFSLAMGRQCKNGLRSGRVRIAHDHDARSGRRRAGRSRRNHRPAGRCRCHRRCSRAFVSASRNRRAHGQSGARAGRAKFHLGPLSRAFTGRVRGCDSDGPLKTTWVGGHRPPLQMNILLVQLKRLGDLILTTPAIAALRSKFPEAKLTLVITRECAPLIPAIKGIDEIVIMHRGLKDAGAFLRLARGGFDYCIDFTRNDRSALIALFSAAKKRVVSYRIKRRSKIRRHFYTDFVEHRMRDMHTIDYNLSLLEPLGIEDAATTIQLDLPQATREKAEELLRDT